MSNPLREALEVASTEIVADFPDCGIEQRFLGSTAQLPREDVLAEGWAYDRAERSFNEPVIQ